MHIALHYRTIRFMTWFKTFILYDFIENKEWKGSSKFALALYMCHKTVSTYFFVVVKEDFASYLFLVDVCFAPSLPWFKFFIQLFLLCVLQYVPFLVPKRREFCISYRWNIRIELSLKRMVNHCFACIGNYKRNGWIKKRHIQGKSIA